MTSSKEINLPKKIVEFGAHHPINQTKDFIVSFLESLGFEIVDGPEDTDKVISQNGLEVYIPKKAYVYLAGTYLDYSDGLNGKGFEFRNPNATSSCGCGDSFSV